MKELCPNTTLITYHPYTATQETFQITRSFRELAHVNTNVELRNQEAIEKQDNIRALRLHSPHDNKKYPGSYIFIEGGHHRTRQLYQMYLEGKLSGKEKILVQLSNEKEYNKINSTGRIHQIIAERDEIRKHI